MTEPLSSRQKLIIDALGDNDGVGLIWPESDNSFEIGGTDKNLSINANESLIDDLRDRGLIDGYAPFYLLTEDGFKLWRSQQRKQ